MKTKTRAWVCGFALIVVCSYLGAIVPGVLSEYTNRLMGNWFGDKALVLCGLMMGMPLGCILGATVVGLRRLRWPLGRWLLKVGCIVLANVVSMMLGLIMADSCSADFLLLVPLVSALLSTLVVFAFESACLSLGPKQ